MSLHRKNTCLVQFLMFITVTVFEQKLKLRQNHVKANNFKYIPTLVKHNLKNCKKQASLIRILIRYVTILRFFIRIMRYSFIFNQKTKLQIEFIELQFVIHFKKKNVGTYSVLFVRFLKFYLPKETYPIFHDHALFIFSIFDGTYLYL